MIVTSLYLTLSFKHHSIWNGRNLLHTCTISNWSFTSFSCLFSLVILWWQHRYANHTVQRIVRSWRRMDHGRW